MAMRSQTENLLKALPRQRTVAFRLAAALVLTGAISAFSARGVLTSGVSVTLAWDPPSTPAVNFRLYYGTSSRTYTAFLSAGLTNAVTISNLTAGVTYYFAATTVDSTGAESVYSEEIIYTPALAPTLPSKLRLGVSPAGQAVLTAKAPAGRKYNVLGSETFDIWVVLGTVTADANGNLQFTDPSPATNRARFYQLQQISP